MSVTSNFGANPCFLRSLRISRNAARVSRRPLHQHVENLAFVIDGTPEVYLLQRSEQPSRLDAIDRSGEGGLAAAAEAQPASVQPGGTATVVTYR